MLRITWPAVLPTWIAALRSGLGLGFMFVVAAELMGASEGLGYLLVFGQQMGQADVILVAMIVFALLGKLSDALLVAVTAPLLRWQDTVRARL
jgi:sulfonate transport system permease protein